TFLSAFLVMLLHRRWQLGVFGTLAFGTWALLSFSVVVLDPLVPLLRDKPRYFFCALCLALLFSVASWYEFWRFLRRKAGAPRWIVFLGPLLAVLALLCMAHFARRTVFKRSPLREG